MKDIILEDYIKETLYDLCKEELHEISLKDFLPKTTLEAGLQIGMVSLLAFLGVEMNKSSKLPATPEAQAELVVDTAEENANSYEKYANDEVKKIVDLYLSSN